MNRYSWSKISYILKFYIICVGLCQDQCQQRCWKGKPDTIVYGGTAVPNAKAETDCKDLCANNGTCVGIDWNYDAGSCWFQMAPTNNYIKTSGVNHWDLVNCSDDCLSYCWKPLKNNSGIWGSQQHQGPMDENRCKLICSQTTNCVGVDWITNENDCWLFNFSGSTETRTGVHHWDIVKNTATNCQPITGSTTSTTSARTGSVQIQVSTSPLSDVPSATGKEESLRAAVIALAVLSGVFLLVIIALVVVLFRKERRQCGQISSSNVKEPEQSYDGLQLDSRSPAPVYTDLQSIS